MLQISSYRDATQEQEAPKASSWRAACSAGSRGDAERVYDDIFDAVMDRRLLPGAKLTETTLCKVFDCSRSTVRAALSALAHDKIVDIEPNRGAFVWQPDAKETRDIFEMRRRMECMIVDMLLALPDLATRLQPLYDMVRRERQAFERGDRISWIRLSNAFHVVMAQLLDNHVLTEIMHSLCARTTLIIALHDTPGETACSYIEHETILDHLAQGDGNGARQAMHHHLADCEERMSTPSTQPPDPWRAFPVKR
ncbi:GntR family transcriptional regulator [Allopusillimonas soli]|uniref:GntR family transcriptional regulator n=1 Tax=Allopusillimonas soli TaxID=659016 RepID=A0A853FIS4_9BURK|nr:GntR family transcriptional regulator [Allopusillimonas soli]NYT37866.1 GntR family transcriptional regulator [Allopusillimonas soli]TEA73769.1 GntR family transcriptional regulator [Allopusillimonas soli]